MFGEELEPTQDEAGHAHRVVIFADSADFMRRAAMVAAETARACGVRLTVVEAGPWPGDPDKREDGQLVRCCREHVGSAYLFADVLRAAIAEETGMQPLRDDLRTREATVGTLEWASLADALAAANRAGDRGLAARLVRLFGRWMP